MPPLNPWRPEPSRHDLLRERLTTASLLLCLFAFGLEGCVRLVRGEHEPAVLTLSAAAAFLVLLIVLERGYQRFAAHGLVAVFLLHGLVKIVGSGGETRIYWALVLLPIVAVSALGLRWGAAWSVATAVGIALAGLLPLAGVTPPFTLDLQLRASDAYAVGAALVLVSLGIAAWHEALRRGFASELRDARQDGERARDALEGSRERYRALMEHSFDGAAIVSAEGELLYLRPAAEGRVLGYRREDLAGRTVGQMAADIIHPDDWERCTRAMADAFRIPGKVVHEVVRLRGRDGRWRVIEAAAHNLTREPAVRGIVLNYRDLSGEHARRNGEVGPQLAVPATEDRLRRFAGGIAHDFNNMLTVVLGRTEQASEGLAADSPARAALGEVEQAARRLAGVTREIVAYTGLAAPVLALVDLGALLDRIHEDLRSALPADVELELHLPQTPVVAPLDAELVTLAANALVENSVEALGGHGRLSLEAGSVVLSGDDLRECQPTGQVFEPGRFARLVVTDDGPGIPIESIPGAFEPFQSSGPIGRGLGLSAVLGIARSHGAAVRLASDPSGGTVVTMLFPMDVQASG